MADPGFLEGGVLIYCWARSAREFLEATPTFDRFLRQSISSTSPIDLFSNEFLLKHSKVSHSSSFFSSVARKGVPIISILLSARYSQKGGSCAPLDPPLDPPLSKAENVSPTEKRLAYSLPVLH